MKVKSEDINSNPVHSPVHPEGELQDEKVKGEKVRVKAKSESIFMIAKSRNSAESLIKHLMCLH